MPTLVKFYFSTKTSLRARDFFIYSQEANVAIKDSSSSVVDSSDLEEF